jgi:energy-coupling factor transporter ATP-binding protein EcfA2
MLYLWLFFDKSDSNSDLMKWINAVESAFNKIHAPGWISKPVIAILIAAFVYKIAQPLFEGITKLRREIIQPLRYTPEQRKRLQNRQLIARHIKQVIEDIAREENWSDARFTELEAEVEAEGRHTWYLLWQRTGRYRTKSLSNALASSQERLIHVEGEPGSGKSTALRHIAINLARKATHARSLHNTIPVYINLKGMKRDPGKLIDRTLIAEFAKSSIIAGSDIGPLLEEEMNHSLVDGTWIFLFDSFDEVPDILSSTEADDSVQFYAKAISSFLSGTNQSRGVIASRAFRAPKQLNWPKFVIQPLSDNGRLELIEKFGLSEQEIKHLLAYLSSSTIDVQRMAENPLFLSLLCDQVKHGDTIPQDAHKVLETFLKNRFTRDESRLQMHGIASTAEVWKSAEQIGFVMAYDQGLGLNPSVNDLAASAKLQFGNDAADMVRGLSALELLRIGRMSKDGEQKTFTFSHRRFQEFFATSVVVRFPSRVPFHKLLTNGNWRETVVVLLQSQDVNVVAGIIEALNDELKVAINQIEATITKSTGEQHRLFPWPASALHILGVLQDGFVTRYESLSQDLRKIAGQIVASAFKYGTLLDHRWALEVAGAIPSVQLTELLTSTFAQESQMLRDVAYTQAARLSILPKTLVSQIRIALCQIAWSGRLNRERFATRAYVARLKRAVDLTASLRLLEWISKIDIALHAMCFVVLAPFIYFLVYRHKPTIAQAELLLLTLLLVSVLLYRRMLKWQVPTFGKKSIFTPLSVFGWAFFIVYVRVALWITIFAGLLLLPVSSILLLPETSTLHWILISAAVVFTISWAPFAQIAAASGQLCEIAWWPLLPLFPILYAIYNPRTIITALGMLLHNWKMIIGVIVYFAGLMFLTKIAKTFNIYGLHAFPWLLGVVSILSAFHFLVLVFRDKRLLRRNANRDSTLWDAQGFAKLLAQFKLDRYRLAWVRWARQNRKIACTPSDEKFISALAINVEKARSLRRSQAQTVTLGQRLKRLFQTPPGTLPESSGIQEFDDWSCELLKKHPLALAQWSAYVLDELWKLDEQMRLDLSCRPTDKSVAVAVQHN